MEVWGRVQPEEESRAETESSTLNRVSGLDQAMAPTGGGLGEEPERKTKRVWAKETKGGG